MSEGRPAPPLSLEALDVQYGSRRALQAIDLEVPVGQFLALAGPNGSGKTTLIRAALGFVTPTSGRVSLFGTDVADLSVRERARRVAWVPQEENPRDDTPLFDYVLYGRYARLEPMERESEDDRAIARGLLQDVGLADRARDGILTLSGGERQRAVLARAMAQGSPLLLLDEPTSHLDIGHQLDLLGRVRVLAKDRGGTVVAAMHDLNLAARFADRIAVLSHGRVVADGPPELVLSEEILAQVWGVVADRRRDPRSGIPYLVPHRVVGAAPVPIGIRGPVHVVGGGGSAASILRALVEQGYRVTAGTLNLLDSDWEAADGLGIPTAIEVPFAPLGTEARAANRGLIERSRLVVVAPFAVGPSNLANLEDLLAWSGERPIVLCPRPDGRRWDFTGGRAAAVVEELRSRGAIELTSIEALVPQVASLVARPDR